MLEISLVFSEQRESKCFIVRCSVVSCGCIVALVNSFFMSSLPLSFSTSFTAFGHFDDSKC